MSALAPNLIQAWRYGQACWLSTGVRRREVVEWSDGQMVQRFGLGRAPADTALTNCICLSHRLTIGPHHRRTASRLPSLVTIGV
jgi:hypothetical protein